MIYQNRDPRLSPAYGVTEAAHYLRIHRATLRAWFFGASYGPGKKPFAPPLAPADRKKRLLSFTNLLEAHVLDAIRKDHEIPLQKVRKALSYLQKHFPSDHPLLDQRFQTDGIDLFIEELGTLISPTQEGQTQMREVIKHYLQRIDRDAQGAPIRLYPFTRKRGLNEPKVVVIDPTVEFGRPVLVGTGIPTAVIADRMKAGDSIEDLADDYGRATSEIQEAIRCELSLEAA